MRKNVVITGVSTGIGNAAARTLLKAGYRVFGSVRKQKDADALFKQDGENFIPLIFDVRDEDAIRENAAKVQDMLGTDTNLNGLINNAGIALGGPLEELDIRVLRDQLEVNVIGTMAVTKAFIPLLRDNQVPGSSGRIITISSVAGKRATPFTGPYNASKHALEGLSDALRMELQLRGIDVILIEPGPIQSEIWNKMPDPEANPFVGSDYEPALKRFYRIVRSRVKKALPADQVGRLIQQALESPKPRTRYVITGDKFVNYTLPGIMPDRWIDKKIGKYLGLTHTP